MQAAFFTEPDDQSCWFYHQWLVAASRPRYRSTAAPAIRRLAAFAPSAAGEPALAVAFDRPVSGVPSSLGVATTIPDDGGGGGGTSPLPGAWCAVSEASPGCAIVWTFIPECPLPPGQSLALSLLPEAEGGGLAVGVLLEDALRHELEVGDGQNHFVLCLIQMVPHLECERPARRANRDNGANLEAARTSLAIDG